MPRTLSLPALLAAAAVALTCAPAAAADDRTWAPGRLLAVPAVGVNDQQLVATPAGEAVAAWVEQDHPTIEVHAAVMRADGTVDGPVELVHDVAGCVLDLATDAAGNVILVWERPNGRIEAVRRPPGGRWGLPETVRDNVNEWGAPRVAMNGRGDAAILWRSWSQAGLWSTRASVSRLGLPWSPPATLASLEEGDGGYDVALTPTGDAVALWIVDPEGAGASKVETATVLEGGTVTPVQTLAASASTKTCPQVEANARGEVAALWHEVFSTQCGERGGDVLALRPAGAAAFSAPQPVPGAQSAASLGTLALGDDGTLAISYDRSDDGQLVAGPFGGPLTVTPFPGQPIGGHGGDADGSQLVALTAGSSVETVRRERDGTLSAHRALIADCSAVDGLVVDQGAGRGAALIYTYARGLELATERPGAPGAGCDHPAPAATVPRPFAPVPAHGVAATRPGVGRPFTVRATRPVLTGTGRTRNVRLRVTCLERCSLAVRATLRAGGRTIARATRRAARAAGRRTLRMHMRIRRGAPRRRLRLAVHVMATGSHGERAVVDVRR